MQEYQKGLPFPPPGDLPDPGIEPTSPAPPALAGGFFTMCLQGNPGKVSLHSQPPFSYLPSGFSHFATSNSFHSPHFLFPWPLPAPMVSASSWSNLKFQVKQIRVSLANDRSHGVPADEGWRVQSSRKPGSALAATETPNSMFLKSPKNLAPKSDAIC